VRPRLPITSDFQARLTALRFALHTRIDACVEDSLNRCDLSVLDRKVFGREQEIRHFRLDCMEDLEVLPRTFSRPVNFQMDRRSQDQSRTMTVRVLFDREIARWVREARSYFVTAEEETEEGLLVTLMIRQQSEILQWLLSWGRHCRIVEPDSLRALLEEEARAMFQNYQQMDRSFT
jgi:hypothetical protein